MLMTHAIEPELLMPLSRRVKLRPHAALQTRQGAMVVVRLFPLPFIVIGLISLVGAVDRTIIAVSGVRVPAVITSRSENSGSDSTEYHVDYTYTVDGDEYPGDSSVPEDAFRSLRVGQLTTALIRRDAPGRKPLLDVSIQWQLGFPWFWTLGWNALISVLVLVIYVGPWIYRRIFVLGVPAAATITEKTSASDDGKTTYTVKYEFTDESGYRAGNNVITGQTTVAKEAWDGIAVGDIHTVLYLPGKRRWNDLYQFGQYRVATGSN